MTQHGSPTSWPQAVHAPSTHCSLPSSHAVPQAPQLVKLVSVLTQVSPCIPVQSVFGLGQPHVELAAPCSPVQTSAAPGQPSDGNPPATAGQQGSPSPPQLSHVPAKQPSPCMHGMLQPPQCCWDDSVSTQVGPPGPLPHISVPAAHAQLPETQASFAPHASPQPPQWSSLFETSTHSSPHATSPCGHSQVPLLQVALVGQLLPHMPQLSSSLARPVVQPLPQSVVPCGQLQLPLVQTAPGSHASPQPPQ